MGPVIYFAKSGTQTIRISTREDGFSIDQIVLSPSAYLTTSPGLLKREPPQALKRRIDSNSSI